MMRTRRFVATGLAAATLISAGPATASAAAPMTRYCSGSFSAKGEQWGYESRHVSCAFARHWSKAFVRHGDEPRRWACVDLGDSGDCNKHHSNKHFDYYAMD